MFLALGRCRSSNALNAIEMLLEGYKVEPETESSLKPLLPAITACFGANLSVVDTVDALKQHQASDDSAGRHALMHKIKTPFFCISLEKCFQGCRTVTKITNQ